MTCLLNYSAAEQSELQLPWLIATAETQHALALDLHRSHFSSETGCLQSLELTSNPQDTLWAMSTVFCRSFFDKVGSRDDAALMVPLADLANHSFWPNSQYALQKAQGVFELRTVRDVQSDDHICISYGSDKGNAHLMANYGFIVPGNPNDQLDFESDNEAAPKLLAGPLLKALGLLKYEEWLCNNKLRREGMTQQDVSTACARDARLSRTVATVLSLPLQVNRLEGKLMTVTSRQERADQRQAVDQLQQQCKRMSQAFSTDSDTDKQLLTSTALTPRHAQAIRARLEHKLLIQAAQTALQTYARSLRDEDMVVRSRAPKRRRKT